MTNKPTNRMEIEWDKDGKMSVEFINLTPEEYAAQSEQPVGQEPVPLHLNLSDEAKKDPHLRTMASECALHGLAISMHIWGE